MSEETKPEPQPFNYFYAGVRFDGKAYRAIFEACPGQLIPGSGDNNELSFTVPTSRIAGAHIGRAYVLKFLGGMKWSFPLGGKWYASISPLPENEAHAPAVEVAAWEIADKSARQQQALTKFSNTEAIDKVLAPLLRVRVRLSIAERVAFDVYVLGKMKGAR